MFVKILRGAVIGILLGVILGIGIPATQKLRSLLDTTYYTKAREENGLMAYADVDGDLACMSNYPEKDLNDVVLRFHVRANSNSERDMALKYKVRDEILMYLKTKINGNMSREEVVKIIENNINIIKSKAQAVVKGEGYGYAIKAYIEEDEFPIRQYGDMILPAGKYEALRIDIGLAKGENFWCILYPTMCITKDAVAIVDEDSKEQIKEKLTDEEYEKLFVNREKKKIKIKFKIAELFD